MIRLRMFLNTRIKFFKKLVCFCKENRDGLLTKLVEQD